MFYCDDEDGEKVLLMKFMMKIAILFMILLIMMLNIKMMMLLKCVI